eukprot:CAMPEP_0178914296 /NCGR_PEP_ID=MMETSP0786-20121207/11345_1 /TAXON_ID=186022 /ORGANISM="Thalassionema frauenfeldii, Strain CCMP 1798" /LENGTH=288 /DNA_ID=CAMNT_0020587185 /DNA_START=79 /DNA_END=945 /DNA_ORIENTATION=-
MTAVDKCLYTNGAGFQYIELICKYPFLKPFYFDFEEGYDPVPVRDLLVDHPFVPIVACSLYGIGILVGRAYLKDKDPCNWRSLLTVWNFLLATFSAIGFLRTLPYLLHIFATYSFEQVFCTDPENGYGCGSTGLWVQLFCLSKFPELIDTMFIVVHKKKLSFLHWYHHITVLLYCWNSYVTKAPSGIIFCVMNYGVHSIMYFYYFLMAIKIRPPWAMMVTILQISQMVVGVACTIFSFYYLNQTGCKVSEQNTWAAFVMYGSYLALFVEFFVGRYLLKSKQSKKKKVN